MTRFRSVLRQMSEVLTARIEDKQWGQENRKVRPGSAASCLLLACLVLLFVSCTPTPESPPGVQRKVTPPPTPIPFSCDMFTLDHWRELRFGVDTPEAYAETVEEVWGVELWTIPLFREGYTSHYGSWNADSSASHRLVHRVQFDREGKLLRVAVSWSRERAPPTLAQMIDCLGTPDYYAAAHVKDRSHWLEFTLWYVEKGIAVKGSFDLNLFRPMAVRPETPMRNSATYELPGSFVVVEAGDLEQMVSDVYGSALQAWKLCLIRPWPGSIEAVEILSYEEYLRCAT